MQDCIMQAAYLLSNIKYYTINIDYSASCS